MLATESAHCIVGESNNVYNSDILKEWKIKKSYSINRTINSASTKNKHVGVIVWGMSDCPSLKERASLDNQYERASKRHKKRQISQTNFNLEISAIVDDKIILLSINTTLWYKMNVEIPQTKESVNIYYFLRCHHRLASIHLYMLLYHKNFI